MARFFGKVGYVHSEKTVPGVIEEVVVAKSYYGDLLKTNRRLDGDDVNSDISVSMSVSILADAYANQNFFAIRYVEWAGTNWTVTTVDVERPRLILRLGEVYNGVVARDNPIAL